jgi:hypothetical protein
MAHNANTIQNNTLASLVAQAPTGVVSAIKKAAANTGVNFAYLVQQAQAESSFKPNIKAKSSSASGLYQFIESTWLNMVKKHGDKYGMGELADKISDSGKVANRSVRKEILALRNDPEKASAMAAEFAKENEETLKDNWGGDVGSTELYFAHFLGAGQASAFLKERDENPMQKAAYLFPAAAKANRNVFYDTRTGRAKSMDEVYAFFDKKFDIKDMKDTGIPGYELPDATEAPTQIASSVFFGGVNTAPQYASNERPAYGSAYNSSSHMSYNSLAAQQLASNPVDIMLLSQLDNPLAEKSEDKNFSRLND